MAFTNFSQILYAKTIDTSEQVTFGSLQLTQKNELKYIRILFFKHGTIGGSESITLNLLGSSDPDSVISASDPILLSTIQNASNLNTSGDWISWIRFDFDRKWIDNNRTYYLGLDISNYTRNADTYYLSVIYGQPFGIYDPNSTILNTIIGQQWFGYR